MRLITLDQKPNFQQQNKNSSLNQEVKQHTRCPRDVKPILVLFNHYLKPSRGSHLRPGRGYKRRSNVYFHSTCLTCFSLSYLFQRVQCFAKTAKTEATRPVDPCLALLWLITPMYRCNFVCILNPTLGHRCASAVGTKKLSGHREEGHLDGLWHPRSGVDRSRLLPVVCQRGLYTLTLNVIDRDLHQELMNFLFRSDRQVV